MAIQTRTVLKGYFNTGDTPTEAQYADVFDSTYLKSETLPSDVAFYDTIGDLPATGSTNTLYFVADVDGDDTKGLRVWYEGIYQDPVAAASAVADGDKGDVTVSGGGATWTIDAGAVTLAKQAAGTANRLQGFDGSGNPSEITIGNSLSLSGAELSVSIPGPYSGDTAAATAGVAVGEAYRLSNENDYDMRSPDGRTVVVRIA